MKISRAGQGDEARWAGGWLGQSLCQPGKELRPAGRVGLYLRGQVHAEALCSFSDSRPGGKGHLDLNNVGFLCSREAGSHSRTEYVEPSEAGARPGLTVGVQFSNLQVTYGPLPTMGLSAPLKPPAGPRCVGAVLTPVGGGGALSLTGSLQEGFILQGHRLKRPLPSVGAEGSHGLLTWG